MTVFMSPRTHYKLGRFNTHLWLSIAAVTVIGTGHILASDRDLNSNPAAPLVFAAPPIAALTCRNGRRNFRRLYRELIFGSLYGFTGVCSMNGDCEVCN